MKLRVVPILAAAFLFLAPAAGHADLAPYSQSFEGLVQTDPSALGNDGWKVFGNVFSPDHSTYYYGYGPFPAPNNAGGFCGIDVGQGGPSQGTQQLVVFSDYNNGDHANGNLIEANTYQEQTIGAADVGRRATFTFDAKKGNLAAPTTALAFIKTLDPSNSYALTNFVQADMTSIPQTWGTYSITLDIDASLVGQIFQIGFANTATSYNPSGIFYDNLSAGLATVDVATRVGPDPTGLAISGVLPNPVRREMTVSLSLPRGDAAALELLDVAGRRILSRQLDSSVDGFQSVRLTVPPGTAPGVYMLRVAQAGQATSRKVCVLR